MKDIKFETFTDFYNEAIQLKKIPNPKLQAGNNKDFVQYYDEQILHGQFVEFLKTNKGVTTDITTPEALKEYLTGSNFIGFFRYFENNKDPRYSIMKTDFKSKADFKNLQREYKDYGYFSLNKKKVYSPELTYVFLAKELPAINLETQKETTVNGFNFFIVFEKGYDEGVKYFDAEFGVPTSVLFGSNAEPYVKTISKHYSTTVHRYNGVVVFGWHDIKRKCPLVLTNKTSFAFGYFSGILSRAEDLAEKYKPIFEAFLKTEKKQPEPQTDKPDTNPKDETNHFSKGIPLSIAREHFKVFTERKSNNGKPFLTPEQFEAFIQRAFHSNSNQPKQKINVVTREKQFVIMRFYEFYLFAVKESYEFQQSRSKFIKLLTDNFSNWEFEDVKSNFNKRVKSRSWN